MKKITIEINTSDPQDDEDILNMFITQCAWMGLVYRKDGKDGVK